jgi:hypothetical protein
MLVNSFFAISTIGISVYIQRYACISAQGSVESSSDEVYTMQRVFVQTKLVG